MTGEEGGEEETTADADEEGEEEEKEEGERGELTGMTWVCGGPTDVSDEAIPSVASLFSFTSLSPSPPPSLLSSNPPACSGGSLFPILEFPILK